MFQKTVTSVKHFIWKGTHAFCLRYKPIGLSVIRNIEHILPWLTFWFWFLFFFPLNQDYLKCKMLKFVKQLLFLSGKKWLQEKNGKQSICNFSHSCFPPIDRLSPIDKNSGRIWNFLSYNITLGHSLGICIYMLIHHLNGIWKYFSPIFNILIDYAMNTYHI